MQQESVLTTPATRLPGKNAREKATTKPAWTTRKSAKSKSARECQKDLQSKSRWAASGNKPAKTTRFKTSVDQTTIVPLKTTSVNHIRGTENLLSADSAAMTAKIAPSTSLSSMTAISDTDLRITETG